MNLGRLLQLRFGVLSLNREEIGVRGQDVCHAFRHLLDLYPNVVVPHERLAPPLPNQLNRRNGTPARNISIAAPALSECVPIHPAGKPSLASPYLMAAARR